MLGPSGGHGVLPLGLLREGRPGRGLPCGPDRGTAWAGTWNCVSTGRIVRTAQNVSLPILFFVVVVLFLFSFFTNHCFNLNLKSFPVLVICP